MGPRCETEVDLSCDGCNVTPCARPAGHEPPHRIVIEWEDEPAGQPLRREAAVAGAELRFPDAE